MCPPRPARPVRPARLRPERPPATESPPRRPARREHSGASPTGAAVCHDTYTAHQAVEHDDMNVLCLGSRVIGGSLAAEVVIAFLSARFSGEERHRRRLGKVLDIERRYLKA